MEFKETGFGFSNTELVQWQDLADMVMKFWFHKKVGNLLSSSTVFGFTTATSFFI